MNDEMRSSGMSALEGYTLGKLSARNQQVLGDAAEAFGRRLFRSAAPTLDVDALIAENEMLRRKLEAAEAKLATALSDYRKLDAWADDVSVLLREAGFIVR